MKRWLCVLLAVTLFLLRTGGMTGMPVKAADAEPEPQASASVLMECTTRTVLSGEQERKLLPMGMLAKLMTVYLAGELLEQGTWHMDTVLTAGDCVSGTKGAVIWLVSGETMTVEDLLKGVIIGNANDAAAVLAEQISGSSAEFVRLMNASAFDLGMRDTVFANPQGYDAPEQHTTARDIGLLCCALSELEELTPIFTTWRDFLRDGATELVNENTFARTYEGSIGWKACHTEDSGWCIAAGAERNGMRCVAVVLDAQDEDARFTIAKNLLRTGFSTYRTTMPGFSAEFMKPLRVKGGISQAVELEALSLNGLVVPKNSPELETVILLPDYIPAPVRRGRQVGVLAFYNGDTLLLETPLVTKNDVPEMTYAAAVLKILEKMFKK